MSIVALKLKIMPSSPETDLKKIEDEAKKVIKKLGANVHAVEKEPIAFGLIALIVTIAWPEEKETSLAEDSIGRIKDVNSVEVIDYRRTLG